MNPTQTLNDGAFREPGTFPTSDEIAEDGIAPPEFEAMEQTQRIGVFILSRYNMTLKQRTALIPPMLLLGTKNDMKMIEERGDNKRTHHEAYEAIPASVAALHAHSKAQRDQADHVRVAAPSHRRNENKVGRNDPCPCDPGKNPRNTVAWQDCTE